MTSLEKHAFGKPSRSSASGTNPSRRTRPAESRVSRLHRQKESRRKFSVREPRIDSGLEIKAALIYAGIISVMVVALAILAAGGYAGPGSGAYIALSFALGLVAASAIASGLTFLIALRHRTLLVALSAALVAAGAIMTGWTALEGVAKIVFATSLGLWITLMLTSIGQLLLISTLIIIVDFYSVFLGPTRKMVESGGPWINYLTINLPAFGAEAVSRLGVADVVFFALFIGCTLTFRLRRVATALALTLSLLATMAVGMRLDIGVPALPLLSVFFILSNADLLYHRFLEEPFDKRDNRSGGHKPGV